MDVLVGGYDATNFSYISKDAQENSTSLDTNVVMGRCGANMVLNEKPTKKLFNSEDLGQNLAAECMSKFSIIEFETKRSIILQKYGSNLLFQANF